MGQKVNPFLFRVILNKNWNSIWYSDRKNFSKNLLEDIFIRKIVKKFFIKIFIIKIIIQKTKKDLYIYIYILNKNFIEKYIDNLFFLKKNIYNYTNKNVYIIFRSIKNFKNFPQFIYLKIKKNIIKKKSYKNVIKNFMNKFFKKKGLGFKIVLKGRLNGSIMTKKQVFKHGSMPLQKMVSNIIYYSNIIFTNYGVIGVKIWFYLGNFIYNNVIKT